MEFAYHPGTQAHASSLFLEKFQVQMYKNKLQYMTAIQDNGLFRS